MSDLDYYKSQSDYDEISEYLDTEINCEDLIEDNYQPFSGDFSNAIVVDNIPQIPLDKVPKLLGVLIKIYSQISPITENDIFVASNDETKMSSGFCFIKFPSAEKAQEAIKVTQGFALDKKHSFNVSPYSDLEVYAKVSENDQPPGLTDFHPRPDVTAWLTDSLCRDQFAVRHSRETEIYWANSTGEEPSLVYGGEREKAGGSGAGARVWCDLSIEWSPQGSYFVTFHKQGVKLWGTDFQACGRFSHPNVEEVSFSPCEKYIITYRHNESLSGDVNEAIVVWDVRTGAKLRAFARKNPFDVKYQVLATVTIEEKNNKKTEKLIRGRVKSYAGDSRNGTFTIEDGNSTYEVSSKQVQAAQDPNKFKWSADGKYAARIGPDVIFIYDVPTMQLLDKRSLATKDVLDFAWSPALTTNGINLISYWSPACGNHPALINLVSIPDRADVASRKIVDVTDGKMIWQQSGEYLCVQSIKSQGKKRSFVLMFFRVKDHGVPVEQLEVSEPVLQVSWEPVGDRVILLVGDVRSPQVMVYSMSGNGNNASSTSNSTTTSSGGTTNTTTNTTTSITTANNNKPTNKGTTSSTTSTKNELTLLFTKSNIQCNEIQWSPSGGVVALCYFAPDCCLFDFLDVENHTIMASRRHDRCSKVTWDPSGRYLATATVLDQKNVSHATKGQPDDGINFYTFQGTLIATMKREKLFAFVWRPRPKDLLTSDEKKKITKNFKKFEKSFDREDKQRKQELNQEIQALRFKLAEEFLGWRNRNRGIVAGLKPQRIALRNGYDSDDDRNYEIETVGEEKK